MSSSPKKLKAEMPSMPGTPEDSDDDTITDFDESPANETPREDLILPSSADYKVIKKRMRVLKRLEVLGQKVGSSLDIISRDLKDIKKQFNKLKKRDKLRRKSRVNRYNVVLITYTPGDESGPDSTCGMIWPNNNRAI